MTETSYRSSAGAKPAWEGRVPTQKRVLRGARVTVAAKRRQRGNRLAVGHPEMGKSWEPTCSGLHGRQHGPGEQTESAGPSAGVEGRQHEAKGCQGT